ncbi:MAG: hypothetical protein LBH22_03405, partial [Bacteroidales bacterium]|nr:hypothetical protein [Bacteroidales bacterium]
MKKIVIFTLFVWSSTLMNAQNSKEMLMLEKFNLRPIESVFDKRLGEIDKETGALRVNRHEYFKSEKQEIESIAWFYLKATQDVYKLNLDHVIFSHTVRSPLGHYVYFFQYINNIPVFSTCFTVYINRENIVKYALNEFRNVLGYADAETSPSITADEALTIAYDYLNIKRETIREPKTGLVYFESMDKGLELAWKINIDAIEPLGSWQVFVNAQNKRIIHVEDRRMFANGTGKVFLVNPLVSANVSYGHNNCYLHNNGATNPCLESQLVQVTLNDLTFENNQYKLKGPYCEVENFDLPSVPIPEPSTPNFNFTRNQGGFAAVMCYYHVDLAARRILELGYNIPNSLKKLKIDPHGKDGVRDASYNKDFNYITMGSQYGIGNTFIPTAEDADVIWHEYAHAMQNHLGAGDVSPGNPQGMTPNWALSLQEGSSDYWATSYKRSLYPDNWAVFALWYDMNNTPGAIGIPRRLDRDWKFPDDYDNALTASCRGQIWSSALMKIWGDLGRDITDKLFLEMHLAGDLSSLRKGATAFMQVTGEFI